MIMYRFFKLQERQAEITSELYSIRLRIYYRQKQGIFWPGFCELKKKVQQKENENLHLNGVCTLFLCLSFFSRSRVEVYSRGLRALHCSRNWQRNISARLQPLKGSLGFPISVARKGERQEGIKERPASLRSKSFKYTAKCASG